MPQDVSEHYKKIANEIISESKKLFVGVPAQRIHGDFHKGNIILRGDDSYFVDFDDMVTGPVVQDVWLCLHWR